MDAGGQLVQNSRRTYPYVFSCAGACRLTTWPISVLCFLLTAETNESFLFQIQNFLFRYIGTFRTVAAGKNIGNFSRHITNRNRKCIYRNTYS